MQDMNHADQVAATRAIINILDTWGAKDSDQVEILALPRGTPSRAVRRYRHDTPLPDSAAVMERVEHVVGIAEALRTTYPRNAQMGPLWMQEPNRRFGDRSPLRTILDDGLGGLIAVRCHLDCTFAWDCNAGA